MLSGSNRRRVQVPFQIAKQLCVFCFVVSVPVDVVLCSHWCHFIEMALLSCSYYKYSGNVCCSLYIWRSVPCLASEKQLRPFISGVQLLPWSLGAKGISGWELAWSRAVFLCKLSKQKQKLYQNPWYGAWKQAIPGLSQIFQSCPFIQHVLSNRITITTPCEVLCVLWIHTRYLLSKSQTSLKASFWRRASVEMFWRLCKLLVYFWNIGISWSYFCVPPSPIQGGCN